MKRRERRRGKERDGTGETKSDQMGMETETWSFLSYSVMGLVAPGLFAIHSFGDTCGACRTFLRSSSKCTCRRSGHGAQLPRRGR